MARTENLRITLIRRIVLVAILCFALVMGFVLISARLETRRTDERTAGLVMRQLELQLLRINVALDIPSRFPEFEALILPPAPDGRCITLRRPDGSLMRSDCTGADLGSMAAPGWFAAAYEAVFSERTPALVTLAYDGKTYGTISVLTDQSGSIARTWNTLKQLAGLTLLTVISLCVMAYFAIERALAPAQAVIAGLGRIAGGDYAHRLPRFRLTELQRVGEGTNTLAERIEATLAERAALARKLIDAQEAERAHLARELHDEFAQNLAAMGALAASLEADTDPDSASGADARTLSRISRKMMDALHQTLAHLRPADLQEFGLAESLRQLIADWNAALRETDFTLDLPAPLPDIPGDTAVHLYRIAQEALTNAAKHSGAAHVSLKIEADPAHIRMSITDDGNGQTAHPAPGSGLGLINMRERVAALGGTLTVTDRTEGGLSILAEVPLGEAS